MLYRRIKLLTAQIVIKQRKEKTLGTPSAESSTTSNMKLKRCRNLLLNYLRVLKSNLQFFNGSKASRSLKDASTSYKFPYGCRNLTLF